jgi:hypothetical protein
MAGRFTNTQHSTSHTLRANARRPDPPHCLIALTSEQSAAVDRIVDGFLRRVTLEERPFLVETE